MNFFPSPLLPSQISDVYISHHLWPLCVDELTLKESLNLSNVISTYIIHPQKLITTLVL